MFSQFRYNGCEILDLRCNVLCSIACFSANIRLNGCGSMCVVSFEGCLIWYIDFVVSLRRTMIVQ